MGMLKLGIMFLYLNNHRIEEKKYFRKLTVHGKQMGVDVFAFSPEDVDADKQKILAHQYDPENKVWRRKQVDFPDIIYDRCRYQRSKRFEQLRKFRAAYPDLTYMNRPLANKWTLHELFEQQPILSSVLPPAQVYTNSHDLFRLLKQHQTVFYKPINGTGGRGIIRIKRLSSGQYHISGRNHHRKMITPRVADKQSLLRSLKQFRQNKKYFLQKGIDITLPNGRVHDYRILIQKDGNGVWTWTGGAARIGSLHSITSNLHGGGKAVHMDQMLRNRFADEETIGQMKSQMEELAILTAQCLEKHYGRLCELALDIAIDRDKHIWLLEINPKPAREIFSKIQDKETYVTAIRRPLEYALWLHKHK